MGDRNSEWSWRQDPSVVKQYDLWAPVYDFLWRRYVDKTVPVAQQTAAVTPGERVVDLACGTGELGCRLVGSVPDVEVVGVDLAPSMIEQARSKFEESPRVRIIRADVHDLPFEDNAFDVAVCANTFHYFSAPETTLREAARVLRPEGRLVVLDWCRDFWTCRVMDAVLRRIDPAHRHCYTLDEMTAFLDATPFDLRLHFRYRFDLIWGIMVVEAVLPGAT